MTKPHDELWPLSDNWSLAIGAIVLFWFGVACGAFVVLFSR